MVYRLALPPTVNVRNVFHVSFLKTYVKDVDHVIDWSVLEVEPEGEFQPEPGKILGANIRKWANSPYFF